MKKSQLYDIYSLLNVSINTITKDINVLASLRGIDADLFYDFVICNKEIITDNNFKHIVLLFYYFDYISTSNYKQKIYKLISEFLTDDYIKSSIDYNKIIDAIASILSKPEPDALLSIDVLSSSDIEDDEADYFSYKCIYNYVQIINSFKKLGFNMYNFNLSKISEIYSEDFLDDLDYTTIIEKDKALDEIILRIEEFTKISVDFNNLDVEKYYNLLKVASNIKDYKELKLFNKRIKRIPINVSQADFKLKLEEYTDEITPVTIEIIKKRLNYIIDEDDEGNIIYKRNKTNRKSNDIKKLEKILINNNTNVIKF